MPRRDKRLASILIASPSVSLRRRWGQCLQGSFVIHEVAERVALEHNVEKLKPSLLLLDVTLPKLGRLENLAAIHRLSGLTKIILLTETPNGREGISALKIGVRGYCNRDIKPFLLKKAVEKVQAGEVWVGRKFVPHLIDELTLLTERQPKDLSGKAHSFDSLTLRELEIAHLIVSSGASNKEIASQLKIAESTVKAHLTAIFRKLGISHRLQLALFVITKGQTFSQPVA